MFQHQGYFGSQSGRLARSRADWKPRPFQASYQAGEVTVPHPVKDLPTGTLKSIEKQSGVKLR